MNYKEAIEYIENTGKFGVNLGLSRIQRLCQLLGNPEKELKIIHVGGTNGKGSTTTFISKVLMAQGYKVGIYTSPYIERFTERIKINNEEIGEEEVASLMEVMLPHIKTLINEGYEHPTEFEIITAAALKYFFDKGTDYVVLEVGLGGRFDATNIVSPLVSVITTISYDHMHILGKTLKEIAGEKAGIIKTGRPVVIYPQQEEAMKVLEEACKLQEAEIHRVDELKYEILIDTEDGIIFNVQGTESYNNLKIKLLGEHQVLNAITALKCIEVLKALGVEIKKEAIYSGFETAVWPGRFEILSPFPHIILDGGHNIEGIKALAKAVKKYFNDKKVHIVCGIFKDKDYLKMVKELCNLGEDFITVAPESPRALGASELAKIISDEGKMAVAAADMKDAINLGKNITKENEVLLFCGSLFMIGEARSILKAFL